jgi:hypothetical protein
VCYCVVLAKETAVALTDILGTPIEVGSVVVACHNKRIILGRIIELFENSDSVKVDPLPYDTAGRRCIPKMKPFRRDEYNVFVINDQEHFMGIVKGYALNTGWFDEDPEYQDV